MPGIMMVLLVLLAVLLAGICLLLFWPVRVDCWVKMESEPHLTGKLAIRFLSGLFRLQYTIEINIMEPARFLVLTRKSGEPRVLWRPGEKKQPGRFGFPIQQVWEHTKLRKLKLYGALGVQEDAFATAMLTGLYATTLQNLLIVLTYHKGQEALEVSILPDFTKACFRLNLEGIALCRPIHIISAILIYGSKNRKGKLAAWRILSKTS